MDVKQVIVLRKDLNMRKGKMCAQAAHASMKVFFDRMKRKEKSTYELKKITPEMETWIEGAFTKVVVSVDNEQELKEVYNKAEAAQIPAALVVDAGRTEFHGEATPTAVAIGPDKVEKIDAITGHLKLL